ncbi:MAG: 30S ribosomal protein S16 [Candidatus Kerfeldbacteria bacterium RIFOXYA2_FULL_38_24]|uniref:Small ribosomal subunit protein bS16 n=1 Tax=Candidatus Kerfeldbacteria bacterium RIFOXYB2_FULL_38_14 TaxID=1798547 RepID=A0A1G2BE29_9BACT|nr:MAG: 30S ribosomal protein S16 [Candidatus Kerfeldbacteria bacterium RIFOXYA2_FULL_38_24]OGY87503.1 MAG: 30S ribosomal protein S16 [Candidatus Kerfeldbacteria bacterium RIFOXYB2_FULL_38_14]OGY90239.1 MAG: 30S ribosomal protein S16 [Candidatus Kerfeldbacteria bacterium RIFOXYC2_FULL_38_9]
MLVIRLARIGRKNSPAFRLVVQEKTQAPKAAAKEILGHYNPLLKDRKDQLKIHAERVKYWLSVGAQTSNTVHNMLVETGVISAPKRRSVKSKKKATTAETEKKAEEPKKAEVKEVKTT